jgi:peptidyl-prolyl cis-trans isomerase C
MPSRLGILALAALARLAAQDEPAAGADPTSDPTNASSSAMVAPLYLGAEPPELRALRAIVLVHDEVPLFAKSEVRSHAEAAELAGELCSQLEAGAAFGELAKAHSTHTSADYGGVLGSFWPGMLRPELDRFLFSAAPGELSPPLNTELGILLAQRIDERAGCLHILLSGEDRAERARELLQELEGGADFRALAREHSDDPLGRERSGAHAIFLRGPTDSLLKAAIFEAPVGGLVGPIESPMGTSLALRVPPEELDPALTDPVIVRARAIWIQEQDGRDLEHCEAFAGELALRIQAGEDMAALAELYDDDPGGRERSGDLGWILRRASRTWPVVERVFLAAKGELVGPLKLSHGFLLLRRES